MRDARSGKRPLLVPLPLKAQTYDIDFAFHVNNQVYVRWLEDLRMEVLRGYYLVMATGKASRTPRNSWPTSRPGTRRGIEIRDGLALATIAENEPL